MWNTVPSIRKSNSRTFHIAVSSRTSLAVVKLSSGQHPELNSVPMPIPLVEIPLADIYTGTQSRRNREQ